MSESANHQLSARQLLALIDLTTLGDSDDESSIKALVNQAVDAHQAAVEYDAAVASRQPTVAGGLDDNVAALCVWPRLVEASLKHLKEAGLSGIPVATVVHFPSGKGDVESVVKETKFAINKGATEIDLVIAYEKLMESASSSLECPFEWKGGSVEHTDVFKIVKACSDVCELSG
eukprot:Selendium_serpulae@DN6047_c0_g2_i1.p1